jgi:allantoinase
MAGALVLRSRRVVTPEGERAASVVVKKGRITAIDAYSASVPASATVQDLGDLALLPGLVDTHVHVNEPGRTEWEGFASATQAAAAGGVTTILDMPLNSIPPTTTVEALDMKRKAAADQSYVDVGFWGGAVPGNADGLPKLADAGVFGFKAFLIDSGVPEFAPLDMAGLEAAMEAVDALFLLHAEDPSAVTPAPSSPRYADFLASRPQAAENRAILSALGVARRTGGRAHILHLSSAQALVLLSDAKRAGVRVTAETCPHYLTLAAEDVPDGATQFKCCPPIRERANADALWEGLRTGAIDCIVSDHSPCSPDLKPAGDFAAAWGGISSLQIGLPVVWTQARRRGFGLADVVRWMAQRPAEIAGLTRKGCIEVGYDADLVALAPNDTFLVDPTKLRHRHAVSPYAGLRLAGVVRGTWLRGELVGDKPRGKLLSTVES